MVHAVKIDAHKLVILEPEMNIRLEKLRHRRGNFIKASLELNRIEQNRIEQNKIEQNRIE
jgi:hypothetical protein